MWFNFRQKQSPRFGFREVFMVEGGGGIKRKCELCLSGIRSGKTIMSGHMANIGNTPEFMTYLAP